MFVDTSLYMRDPITVTLSKLNQLAQSTAQYRMSDRASMVVEKVVR
jgi:hypothetical protein